MWPCWVQLLGLHHTLWSMFLCKGKSHSNHCRPSWSMNPWPLSPRRVIGASWISDAQRWEPNTFHSQSTDGESRSEMNCWWKELWDAHGILPEGVEWLPSADHSSSRQPETSHQNWRRQMSQVFAERWQQEHLQISSTFYNFDSTIQWKSLKKYFSPLTK